MWLDVARRRSCKPDDAGANPVVGPLLNKSRWCNGQHKTLLRSWSWFESRLGHFETWPVGVPDSMSASEAVGPGSIPGRATDGKCPASVMDGMADFESVGRGSIPRRGAVNYSLSVWWIARDSAKVVGQVRFLDGLLKTDAGARRRGNRLQPGRSGFDSHRRLSERS